jgi:hypothetical protein
MTEAGHTIRKRREHLGRGLLWCLAALIVLEVAATIVTGHRLKVALVKVKAEGAPVTFAEATPPPIPAGRNAASLYLQAAEIIQPHTYIGKRELSPTGTGYVREAGQPLGYGGWDWLNAEDVRGVADLLKQDAHALELLDRAAALPGCRFDDDWAEVFSPTIHFPKVRDVARFCADAASVAATQGDAAATARRLQAGLALSAHIARTPTFTSQTVAYALFHLSQQTAEYALPRCAVSEADARAILALLTGIDLRTGLVKAMQTERAKALSIYGVARQKPRGPSNADSPDPWMGWAIWSYARVLPPLFRHDETAYLEYMERTIHAATAQWNDFPRLSQELKAWSEGGLKCTFVARILNADLSRVAVSRLNCQARLNLLCGALGLSVYKQHSGRYPDSLTDLARINWPVPQDPFSSGPLRYKPAQDSYLLYSIGPDGVDDGGNPAWGWRIDQSGPKPRDEERGKGDLLWQWR